MTMLRTGLYACMQAQLKPYESVLIAGSGTFGICTVMLARIYNARNIVVAEPDPYRAALAAELGADAVFKGTTVEGVFDSDPRTNPDAKLISDISYADAIARGLRVMDLTAFMLCMEQKVPVIRVFSMEDLDNILRVADGAPLGTVVHA